MNTSTGQVYLDLTPEQLYKLKVEAEALGQKLVQLERAPRKFCYKYNGRDSVLRGSKFKPCTCTTKRGH